MSKCIQRIPLESIERVAVVFGGGRSLAQCKGTADFILNGGFYDMSTGKPVGHLKADGTVHSRESWSCWGYAWDTADISMKQLPAPGRDNYISGVPLLTPWEGIDAPLNYNAEVGGSRPRTAMALDSRELILYCADTPVRPEKLRDELYAMGAETALMLDSGGSSQCDFKGKTISSSRRVNNYIAVWLKKDAKTGDEEGTVVAKKVVLDPGHGVETPGKRSPDGTYLEHEFNLDMAGRIAQHLKRHGVEVILTRTDEHEPVPGDENACLAKRVEISNTAKPDLFVSIHSNASGDGTDWTAPNGYGIYTSKAGESAGRNIAAKAILARVKEAGITLWGGGLHHELFYVLRNTVAPAVLIEHGFHTNKTEVERLKNSAYRDKLAAVDAKGILDYLGIAWQEAAVEEVQPGGGDIGCPHCGGKLKIEKG